MGARHKKTRKEKMIADYRHQVYVLKSKDILSNNQIDNPIPAITISENIYLNTHALRDILKTGILTFTIIALQIILFFLLQKHILTLPIVKY
jgi:hypothetical protein